MRFNRTPDLRRVNRCLRILVRDRLNLGNRCAPLMANMLSERNVQ